MSKPFTREEMEQALECMISRDEAIESITNLLKGEDNESVLKSLEQFQSRIDALLDEGALEVISRRAFSLSMARAVVGADNNAILYNALLTGVMAGIHLSRNRGEGSQDLTLKLVYH
jgi:hypothetical protein